MLSTQYSCHQQLTKAPVPVPNSLMAAPAAGGSVGGLTNRPSLYSRSISVSPRELSNLTRSPPLDSAPRYGPNTKAASTSGYSAVSAAGSFVITKRPPDGVDPYKHEFPEYGPGGAIPASQVTFSLLIPSMLQPAFESRSIRPPEAEEELPK